MRLVGAGLLASVVLLAGATAASVDDCPHNADPLGVSRTLEVDTKGGPRFGTWQYPTTLDLEPGEVVLTFDDGPHPRYTRRILRALDRHCVKATFFAVGVWARYFPKVVRTTAERGHTIGSHTWSHPARIDKLRLETARQQIEHGFDAVRAAAGRDIAPFLRFPGLRDSEKLSAYAANNDYGVFSCDIATDDWRGINARTIVRRTLARLKHHGRGIVLLHDSKPGTARALPLLLSALKRHGYRIVHIVPKVGAGKSHGAAAPSR